MSASATPGLPTIKQATFTSDCTEQNDLIRAGIAKPEIRMEMEYANPRSLTSLIASGNVTPYGITNPGRAKISNIESSSAKPIGNSGYQFPVMGKLTKASVILSQIGTTQADGRFQLLMKDRHLYDGMNVIFNGQGFQARVEGNPTGSDATGYVYNFKSSGNINFNWSTHVARQQGTKTCMGAYSSYSEGSRKGHSYSSTPNIYINHTTIQRKTVEITGSAASQVLWYTFTDKSGNQSKGWMYQAIQQNQAIMIWEDEMQKLFGVSNMKNADGSYKAIPEIDPTTGYGITMGDGLVEQISGGLVIEGSSPDGNWNLDDIIEAQTQLEQNSDKIMGFKSCLITGTRGFANFQKCAMQLGIDTNTRMVHNVNGTIDVGGKEIDMGYNYCSINYAGNQMICIKHTILDDQDMWTELGQDGNPLMSSFGILLDVGTSANRNVETFYKSANGVNRKNVSAAINGLTGDMGTSVSEEDFNKFAMLKEELITMYRTKTSAILKKAF